MDGQRMACRRAHPAVELRWCALAAGRGRGWTARARRVEIANIPMWYVVGMKPIQVTFDAALLERLDRHPTVRERGRSAVLRAAAADFLARKDAEEIDRRYVAGYGGAAPTDDRRPDGGVRDGSDRGYGGAAPIDDELDGWSAEGAWPEP